MADYNQAIQLNPKCGLAYRDRRNAKRKRGASTRYCQLPYKRSGCLLQSGSRCFRRRGLQARPANRGYPLVVLQHDMEEV
jgi:hypothetical protein